MKKIVLMVMVFCVVGMVGCGKDEESINNGGTTTVTPGGGTDPGTDPGTQPVPDGWVDLGLPSGLLWATCNLGATTPEGYGGHYAWGETQTKSDYSWDTYTYGDYDSETGTYTMYKYNTMESYGTVDNKTVLEAMDDVATQVLGGGARIPTKAEWQELLDNTTGEWTQQNGVSGRKFTAANGSGLFLPAAGYRYGSESRGAVSLGFYWSASLDESLPYDACDVSFNSDGQNVYLFGRNIGRSVRAVRSRN